MKNRLSLILIYSSISALIIALAFYRAPAAAELSADPQIRPLFKQGIENIFNMEEKSGIAAFLQGIELDRERPIGYAYLAMANLFFLEMSFENKERERRQEDMLRYAAEAIARGEKRIEKDRRDGQAYFAMALAKIVRIRWYISQRQFFAMAQETTNVWDYLEKAKEEDPQNYDVFFATGLLHFHLDHLPGLTRFLSSLLITSGDRKRGLEELALAAQKGDMLKDLARAELASVYLNFEKKPEMALPYSKELKDKYPSNYNFAFGLGNVLADLKRFDEAFQVAGEIERGIKSGAPPYRPELGARHQLLLGRIYFEKGDHARALGYFQKVIQDQARYNARTRAWAFVRLGMIADVRKEHKQAEEYYQKALEVEGGEGVAQAAARQYLKTPYVPTKPESKS
jgi:tetratricopeptide (TPR) repeat protein